MPKKGRKGHKPPTRDPRELASAPKLEAQPKGKNGKGAAIRYTIDDVRLLHGRLFKFIGVETRIELVINKMEQLKIDPHVKQLSRMLRRIGVYPPPADHADHAKCPCEWCSPKSKDSARRSFPKTYSNARGLTYEHFLERRELDDAAEDDEGMKEAKELLRGSSPGLIADLRGLRNGKGRAA